MFHELIEATLGQLNTKQTSITRLFPDFFTNPVKVKGVISKGGVRLSNIQKDKWTFNVHSGTEEGLQYEVVVRWKDVEKDVQKLVSDRRNWTKDKKRADLRKVAAKLFKDGNVELSCECPAQTYYGGDYLLTQKHAKYGDQEDRSPDIRNPKKYGQYCKHIQVLMRTLPFYKTTIANWLGKEFKDLIARAEGAAVQTTKQYRAAGQALAKRTAKESIVIQETALPPIQAEAKKLCSTQNELVPVEGYKYRYSFWILADGTLISGSKEHHFDLLWGAFRKKYSSPDHYFSPHTEEGFGGMYNKFQHTQPTPVRGGAHSKKKEMYIEFYESEPSPEQISTLKMIFQKLMLSKAYIDFPGGRYFRGRVSSSEHLEHILTYGPPKEFEESVQESVSAVETLPAGQQKIKDKIESSSELSDSMYGNETFGKKFLILNDGTIIPVPKTHGDIVHIGRYRDDIAFGVSGGVEGTIFKSKLELYRPRIGEWTDQQIDSLVELWKKYHLLSLYHPSFDRVTPIRSVDQLRLVIQHGPEYAKSPVAESIQEAVATLPDSQQALLDQFGPASEEDMHIPSIYPGEEAYFKFWLLSDGTLIHVPVAHVRTARDVGTDVDALLESGAVRILVNNQHLGAENLKTITRTQRSAIVDLYLRYGPEELASEAGSGAIHSSEHLRKLLGESIEEDEND